MGVSLGVYYVRGRMIRCATPRKNWIFMGILGSTCNHLRHQSALMAGLLPETGTVRARKQPRLLSGCDHSPALICHPGQPAFHLPHQSPSPATALLCTSSGLLTPFSQFLFLLPFCRFQCTRRDRRFVACVGQESIKRMSTKQTVPEESTLGDLFRYREWERAGFSLGKSMPRRGRTTGVGPGEASQGGTLILLQQRLLSDQPVA